MSTSTVILKQHPVGQGGMMSGLLETPRDRFHWVYDCGSNQIEALNREIRNVAAQGPVDVLFLSHLDKDHVHGVETLLEATKVREVVLPYLDNVDRLLAVAYGAASGSLTGSYMAMLNDPLAWFRERGVEQINFINPDDDEDGEPVGLEVPGGGGTLDGPLRPKWWPSSLSGKADMPKAAPDSVLMLGSMLWFPAIDWVLLPYAHKPSKKKLLAFRQALNAAFGRAYRSKGFFASIASDRDQRAKLRSCYDEIWRDHNLVSMALYAGPSRGAHGWNGYRFGHWRRRWYVGHADEAGWLGTGDMHLDVAVRSRRFFEFYRPILDRVNVFGLPHHGSRHNFDQGLLPPMPNLTQAVAATGPNSYGHPSAWVKDCVRSTGREFVKVSDRGRRVLIWRHEL